MSASNTPAICQPHNHFIAGFWAAISLSKVKKTLHVSNYGEHQSLLLTVRIPEHGPTHRRLHQTEVLGRINPSAPADLSYWTFMGMLSGYRAIEYLLTSDGATPVHQHTDEQ